jgi:hypothetical protein
MMYPYIIWPKPRFMRAYFYAIAMDLYGNAPFATETDLPGTFTPKQISRADLFKYVESELIAIQPGWPRLQMSTPVPIRLPIGHC